MLDRGEGCCVDIEAEGPATAGAGLLGGAAVLGPVSNAVEVPELAASDLATLHEQLEQMGLSPSEARILVALQRVGTATAPQLARLSGVARTNAYTVIEALVARRLATR